jgi:hypothetical protein
MFKEIREIYFCDTVSLREFVMKMGEGNGESIK